MARVNRIKYERIMFTAGAYAGIEAYIDEYKSNEMMLVKPVDFDGNLTIEISARDEGFLFERIEPLFPSMHEVDQ